MVDSIITCRVVTTLNNIITIIVTTLLVIIDIRLIVKCHLSQFIEVVLQGISQQFSVSSLNFSD